MRTFSPVFAASSWRSSSIVFDSCFSALTCVLVEQRDLARPLRQLALDDLLDHVVGLALLARLLLEDPALGLALLLGDLVRGDVAGRGRGDVQRDLVGERLEVLVAGDEVGLALDLDHRPDLVVGVDVGGDDALVGAAALALGGRGLPLDAQDLDRALDVAVGLGQRRLAVHHRRRRCGRAAPSRRLLRPPSALPRRRGTRDGAGLEHCRPLPRLRLRERPGSASPC